MPVHLTAGVASANITPETPIDLVGYSRRWAPATEVRHPLTARALVFDDGDSKIAIVALDILSLRPAQATRIRELVATAIGTRPEAVMLNVSHTHAGPQAHTGGVKIGGAQKSLSPAEHRFIDSLPDAIVSVVTEAASRLEPARVDAGSGTVALGVNRRERTPDGRTILGWNPEGIWDREVGVLRVDRTDGTTLALVVNFACHPVVVGPEDPAINADFAGPLRRRIDTELSTTTLFLQGAGGNVLPLEGFHDHAGPEDAFGERLALEAIHVAADLEPHPTEVRKLEYGSVTPISLYRRHPVPDPPEQPLGFAGTDLDLPLKRLPTEEDVLAELEGYASALEEAAAEGLGKDRLNPLEYHVNWAEEALRQIRSGEASDSTPVFLQAFRIGDVAISAIPGEVFSEIALQIKEGSPAPTTLFAGYTNGVVSYLPTAAEFPYGGYECDYAHHSFGLVEQVAPESEALLVDTSLDLVNSLFR